MEQPESKPASEVRGGLHLERMLRAAAANTLLPDDELREHFVVTENPRTVGLAHSIYTVVAPQTGDFTVSGYYGFPCGVGAILETAERGRWTVATLLEEDDRISGGLTLPLPEHVTLRRAVEADRAALEQLNRESPVVMGDVAAVYEPDDIFAAERLMGSDRAFVGEIGGEVVALGAGASVPARLAGESRLLNYLHRSRVAPSARRGGVRGPVVWASLVSGDANSAGGHALVHRGNAANLRLYPPPLVMDVEPERLVIDIRAQANAAAQTSRAATAEDAGRLVELLNAAHEGEQLYVPYSADSLGERLSRDPALYSWEHFRISDRATIGVWSNAYRVARGAVEPGDQSTPPDQQTRALVLDFGFEPGAEAEFVALLQATCAELAEAGNTELTLMTSPGSPGYDLLRPLAHHVDGYALLAGGAFFADLSPGPVYIDQLYF